jgi:hypothetical protein
MGLLFCVSILPLLRDDERLTDYCETVFRTNISLDFLILDLATSAIIDERLNWLVEYLNIHLF